MKIMHKILLIAAGINITLVAKKLEEERSTKIGPELSAKEIVRTNLEATSLAMQVQRDNELRQAFDTLITSYLTHEEQQLLVQRIESLLIQGADPNIFVSADTTPLSIAVTKRIPELVK